MNVENLKSQIKFVHEMEAEELIEEAEEQAKKTVKEAEGRAEKIKQQKMQEVSEKLREREASELAVTKLEGRKKILNAKSRLVEEAIAKSMDKLKEVVNSGKPIYKESLERLIVEATAKLKGTEFQVLTNPRDRKIVKENIKELERKIAKSKGASVSLEVEETPNTLGGVIVQTKDKKQIFNNTLEARLIWVRQEMVGKISDSLFEGVKD